MYLLASVCPSVTALIISPRCLKRAEKSHFQSEVFVCVSTNRADAVDRLLICSCGWVD